jgi:tetratricopeptide (TPR) repeat protein
LLLLLHQLSFADMPLPTYEDWLARSKWHEVNATLEANCRYVPLEAAIVCEDLAAVDRLIGEVESFQRHVLRDAGLEYLVGLAWRYKGGNQRARGKFESAIALDPNYTAPWSDLGELYILSGDFSRADAAFAQVTRLENTGPKSWIGPWRQAEVAALLQDPQAFDAHMHEALARGFSFRQIEGLPNWKAFYADPVMRDAVEKLITVYGSREILDSLAR